MEMNIEVYNFLIFDKFQIIIYSFLQLYKDGDLCWYVDGMHSFMLLWNWIYNLVITICNIQIKRW